MTAPIKREVIRDLFTGGRVGGLHALIEIAGTVRSLAGWCAELRQDSLVVRARVAEGWCLFDALNAPTRFVERATWRKNWRHKWQPGYTPFVPHPPRPSPGLAISI